jgi:hypothetical protein
MQPVHKNNLGDLDYISKLFLRSVLYSKSIPTIHSVLHDGLRDLFHILNLKAFIAEKPFKKAFAYTTRILEKNSTLRKSTGMLSKIQKMI